MAITIMLAVLTLFIAISDGFMGEPDNEFPEPFHFREPEFHHKFEPFHFPRPSHKFEHLHKHNFPFPSPPSFDFKKFPKFEHIKPLSRDEMINYQPEKGENFVFSSVVEHHSSNTVNGVETSEGDVAAIVSDNAGVSEVVDKYEVKP